MIISNARTANIVSTVRINLASISPSSLIDEQIISTANFIQGDILRKTKSKEYSGEITLVSGQESYDFPVSTYIQVTNLLPSYQNDPLKLANEGNWGQYRNVIGSIVNYGNPTVAMIFNKQIFVAPVPMATTPAQTIQVLGIQMGVITPMTGSNDPEVPEEADLALIFGICSVYDPKNFIALYGDQVDIISSTLYVKSSMPKIANGDWSTP